MADVLKAEGTIDAPADVSHEGVRRRDFINIAAVSFAGIGGVAVLVPLISQMSASADVLAESSTEIDISAISPGQAIKAMWRKQPVFVRNLTPTEIAEADAVNVATLRDPQTLEQRTMPGKTNWLITMGVCTHLGCVPLGAGPGEVKGELAATSALATARSTIPPRAFAKVRRPKTLKCRRTNSTPPLSSRSAKEIRP